jgi:hypothetical protein
MLACELTDTEVVDCLKIGPQDMLSRLDMPVGSDGANKFAPSANSVR